MATALVSPNPAAKISPKMPYSASTARQVLPYFALPFDTPEEFADFEFIRWFLLHERANGLQGGEDWYLLVHTTCRHPAARQPCGIYDTRPQSAAIIP